jgi:hypothetical protein
VDCEHLLGQFIDQQHYDLLITEDCDLYAEDLFGGDLTEDNIIFKFRKKTFTEEEQALAYTSLRPAATQSQNRGLAAGPRGDRLNADGRSGRDWVTSTQLSILDWLSEPEGRVADETLEQVIARSKQNVDETRGFVWLRSRVLTEYPEYEGWFDRWFKSLHNQPRSEQRKAAEHVKSKFISDTNYAQSVMSGIAGFFDRYPRIPYGRATSYTEKHPDEFAKCFPYVKKLDKTFKKELPKRWKKQRSAADRLDAKFTICNSVITTLTCNHNWRTAAHRDAGDLNAGFSNISAFTGPEGKGWQGGEFILPEYRVAIKLEPRDLLLVNNHGGIHGNAPLLGGDNDDRLTVVAYFREKMLELKSWNYEKARRDFVEACRTNEKHPYYKPLFNGVWPGMFESKDWAEFLKARGLKDEENKVVTSDAPKGLDALF